jgi:hypothetical protein
MGFARCDGAEAETYLAGAWDRFGRRDSTEADMVVAAWNDELARCDIV